MMAYGLVTCTATRSTAVCRGFTGARWSAVPARLCSTTEKMTFEDHREAFRHKTTWEVVRALAVLRLCSSQTLVDNSLQMMRWLETVGGETGLRLLLKRTLYAQFVGGETPVELKECMGLVSKAGMRCMLAATMEEDVGEKRRDEVYNGNCGRILQAIDISAGTSVSPMIQLKLSGLLPARLLVDVGNFYTPTGSRMRTVEALANGLTGNSIRMSPFEGDLSHADRDALGRAVGRLREICLAARKKGVRVLVDAEQTYLNEGLSAMALGAAAAFNSDAPVVWNTYQCYLKEGEKRLLDEMQMITEQLGVQFGAKMVRGAYMLQERLRAQKLGLPDPVCDDYSATNTNYDKVICFLLDRVADLGPRCQFIAATHNEDSIRLVIQRMEHKKLDRRLVCFGQLYGMCDQISKPLAERGFAVYKSIPYGTISEVLPYLARRALENRSVLEGARKEHTLLARELRTRLLPRPFRNNSPVTRP